MKLKLKQEEINLKAKTLEDISTNHENCDVQKFINYISEHLEKTNNLSNCKIENLNERELYQKLKEIFYFAVEKNDYLKALSIMCNKHYTDFININTNMFDNNGKNITYQVATISSKTNLNGSTLDLNLLRKLTKKDEILLVKKILIEPSKTKKDPHKEKYENHQFIEIDINESNLNEDSDLFLYFIEILKKDILVKDILHATKLYIDELMYQAKSIIKLSEVRNNQELALIGKKYKKAFEKYFEDQTPSQKTKIPKYKRKRK